MKNSQKRLETDTSYSRE